MLTISAELAMVPEGGSPPKKHIEYIFGVYVTRVRVLTPHAPPSSTAGVVRPVQIVVPLLLRIAQDTVCHAHSLEGAFRFWSAVLVRVKLKRKLFVRLLHGVLSGVFPNAQNLVVTLFPRGDNLFRHAFLLRGVAFRAAPFFGCVPPPCCRAFPSRSRRCSFMCLRCELCFCPFLHFWNTSNWVEPHAFVEHPNRLCIVSFEQSSLPSVLRCHRSILIREGHRYLA
mmetsp:Transcript_54272/g.74156  ORF Transcript_54272/g.74156 Transcript_54272/m.74156 type:complete len:226 (-) Transcript_54272:16-693(-)